MALGTVSHQTTLEVVPLDSTLESLSDGFGGDVDEVALLEELVELELLARVEGVDGHQPEFLQVAQRRRASLAEVAQLRAGELVLAHAVVPDLHGVVAVGGRGLHLRHHVAPLPEPDHRHRHRLPVGRVEVGHHPHLGRHHPDARLVGRRPHNRQRRPPPAYRRREGHAATARGEEAQCAADARGRHGHGCCIRARLVQRRRSLCCCR